MTFQELLTEVKKLSREEQNKIVAALKDDLDATPFVSLTTIGEFEIWSPEVESLEPFQKALAQYKQGDSR